MKGLVLVCIGAAMMSGCASTVSRRSSRPVIREFFAVGVKPGVIAGRSDAEVIAREYFHEFDESGSIQFSAEERDRWIFNASAGDFVAVPVADIFVMKDGSMILQNGVAPRVRLTNGRWLYDFREVRPLLWDLDENPTPQKKPKSAEPASPSRAGSPT